MIKQIIVFLFDSIPDWYKPQEMRDRVISKDPSLIVFCPDEYITKKMCEETF